ncbi:MAG: class I SAM-dependent methyltransferase [Acidobacteriota bacterium]
MPLLSSSLTRIRLSRVQPYLGKRILDLGCGHGELLDYLPEGVEGVVLADRSTERQSCVEAKMRLSSCPSEFTILDVEGGLWNWSESSFDTVVMAALLEHLQRPGPVLRRVHGSLTTGGRLVLTTPTPLGGLVHRFTSRLGLTYREAAEEHVGFFDLAGLESLITSVGFRIERLERFLLGLNQLAVARKP